MNQKRFQTGFTLIEILVVIAIIGLLGSVILTQIASSRIKARDAKRKTDLIQLQKAVELYFNTNGAYPCTGTSGVGNCSGTVNIWTATGSCGSGTVPHTLTGSNGYIPDLAPTFLSILPVDPKPSATACTGYGYQSNGVSYKIVSTNNTLGGSGGPETFPASGQPFYDPARINFGMMVTNNSSTTAAW